jgi:hypothetical protein
MYQIISDAEKHIGKMTNNIEIKIKINCKIRKTERKKKKKKREENYQTSLLLIPTLRTFLIHLLVNTVASKVSFFFSSAFLARKVIW